MSDLTDRLRQWGDTAGSIGYVRRLHDEAADVLEAIDALHTKVYGQAGPLPYCESCGDTHLWPCPTHRLLHPEEGER